MSTTLLRNTVVYCAKCNKNEIARIIEKETGGVYLEKLCPNEKKSIKLAASRDWYESRMRTNQKIQKNKNTHPSKNGCPLDCGICESHTSSLHLAVFSITNACNLDCPICFTYNRSDIKYHKSAEDTSVILNHVLNESPNIQLINLTGGEPTMHPNLFEILDVCKSKNFPRITMNTNGIKIAHDKEFAQKIKDYGIQLVLSLDTMDKEKSILIHGRDITKQKQRALEILEELDIPTTILNVCIKGVNEEEINDFVHYYLKKGFVKSITIQNMTFTGKNGKDFQPREHITMDEVESLLATKNEISLNDFFPLASYHPLCYSVAYYIAYKDKLISLTRILSKDVLLEMSENSYILSPKKNYSEQFLNGLNELWANGGDEDFIQFMKGKIKELYPTHLISDEDRRRILNDLFKTIYIHPHMDEDNFDLDRVSRCGDLVPDENGAMIPACSYNLLYRQKDSRFWTE